jgi:hypothetical protein
MIRNAFPALMDASLDGRRRFLNEWEDRLWAYWEEQLSIFIVDRSIDPTVALGRAWEGAEQDACRMIADRMVQALRERPTLQRVKPWTDVRGWYAWLVGSRAMSVDRRREEPLDETRTDMTAAHEYGREAPDPVPDMDQIRAAIAALIDEWVRILHQIVAGTGIAAIERDWLWATCAARRQLSRYLGAVGMRAVAGALRLTEHRRKALVGDTSAPGSSRAERTERTRCGAAACFRFNLATWASNSSGLAAAHRVFLGPADPRPPYRPRADVEADALDGVRQVLRRTAAARDALEGSNVVARLRALVAECALRSAVARLLPRAAELQLEKEWNELVAPRRSP